MRRFLASTELYCIEASRNSSFNFSNVVWILSEVNKQMTGQRIPMLNNQTKIYEAPNMISFAFFSANTIFSPAKLINHLICRKIVLSRLFKSYSQGESSFIDFTSCFFNSSIPISKSGMKIKEKVKLRMPCNGLVFTSLHQYSKPVSIFINVTSINKCNACFCDR